MEDFNRRGNDIEYFRAVLIINVDVKDNHSEAASAAPYAERLCEILENSSDMHSSLDNILASFGIYYFG